MKKLIFTLIILLGLSGVKAFDNPFPKSQVAVYNLSNFDKDTNMTTEECKKFNEQEPKPDVGYQCRSDSEIKDFISGLTKSDYKKINKSLLTDGLNSPLPFHTISTSDKLFFGSKYDSGFIGLYKVRQDTPSFYSLSYITIKNNKLYMFSSKNWILFCDDTSNKKFLIPEVEKIKQSKNIKCYLGDSSINLNKYQSISKIRKINISIDAANNFENEVSKGSINKSSDKSINERTKAFKLMIDKLKF